MRPRQGAIDRTKKCPEGARQQGKRLLGYLTHVLLHICPIHTFGLIFFPLFTEYIDVFGGAPL